MQGDTPVIRNLSIGFKNRGWNNWSITPISKVGIQTGWVIDHIRINDTKYGGNGGGDRGTLHLTEDEYISEVEYRYGTSRSSDFGDSIIFLKFTTNKGRSISSIYDGTEGTYGKLENIKLLGIGGRSDHYVRKIDFLYIENYDPYPSAYHSWPENDNFSISSPLPIAHPDPLIPFASHQGFILEYTPPFGEFQEYTSSFDKIAGSYEKIAAHMTLNQDYYKGILGCFVKVTSSALLLPMTSDMTLGKLGKEIEKRLEKKNKKTHKIPEGYVGVMLVHGEIMKGSGDTFYMFPMTVPSYSIIKIGQENNLLGYYDLTGGLYTQMPNLKSFKTIRNGYVYYGASLQPAKCAKKAAKISKGGSKWASLKQKFRKLIQW